MNKPNKEKTDNIIQWDEMFEFLPCLFIGYAVKERNKPFPSISKECITIENYIYNGNAHDSMSLHGYIFPFVNSITSDFIAQFKDLATYCIDSKVGYNPLILSQLCDIKNKLREIGPLHLETSECYSECSEAFIPFDPVLSLPWIRKNFQVLRHSTNKTQYFTEPFKTRDAKELLISLNYPQLPVYADTLACFEEAMREVVFSAFLYVNEYPSMGF